MTRPLLAEGRALQPTLLLRPESAANYTTRARGAAKAGKRLRLIVNPLPKLW